MKRCKVDDLKGTEILAKDVFTPEYQGSSLHVLCLPRDVNSADGLQPIRE